MTGDFNTPSHLDWTPAVDGRPRRTVHYPVPWPVTSAVAAAGFIDAYRAVHPDPVAAPGHHVDLRLSVPAPRAANEVVDRIDIDPGVARASQVLDSGIVGPSGTPDVT